MATDARLAQGLPMSLSTIIDKAMQSPSVSTVQDSPTPVLQDFYAECRKLVAYGKKRGWVGVRPSGPIITPRGKGGWKQKK